MPNNEYHIRLDPGYECYYNIVFTNDNWLTYEKLDYLFYLKDDFPARAWHEFEKNEAIVLANKLKTYSMATNYNDSIQLRIKTINDSLAVIQNNKPKVKKVEKQKECEKPETILIR